MFYLVISGPYAFVIINYFFKRDIFAMGCFFKLVSSANHLALQTVCAQVRAQSGSIMFVLWWYSWNIFCFKKLTLKNKSAGDKSLKSTLLAKTLKVKFRICFAVANVLSYRYKNMTSIKVSKGTKIRNRYNQVPNLTQDTNGKVTNSQLDTTNESQEVSPFPAGYHRAHINRRAQRHTLYTLYNIT